MLTKCSEIYSILPARVSYEIGRVAEEFSCGLSGVSEIRLVRGVGSSFIMAGSRYKIYTRVSGCEMDEVFFKICSGSIYAHRDTVKDGYVSIADGIRVGVSGTAKYDGGALVGVSDINALVFRIPTADFSLKDELYSAYSECERGLLIYSKAGVGKTTALRTLVPLIAKREPRENIAVIDERCEFSWEDFSSTDIDIFRGYKRKSGMQIALRVMSPQIIAVDEIGTAEEAEQMLESLGSGVRFIATAHASSIEELMSRKSLRPLIDNGVFDVFAGIFNADGHYFTQIYKKDYAEAAGVIL